MPPLQIDRQVAGVHDNTIGRRRGGSCDPAATPIRASDGDHQARGVVGVPIRRRHDPDAIAPDSATKLTGKATITGLMVLLTPNKEIISTSAKEGSL